MLTAISCHDEGIPSDVMNEDKMISYLIDLHIAEAQVQNLRLRKDSSKIVFAIYEKHLLEKHQLTDSIFVKSYNYYLRNPQQLEKIYEAVVDSISVRKSVVDAIK